MNGFLILEDGQVFEGKAISKFDDRIGELVFTTSMCGYQEAVTDPAAKGQIVIMTYPIIGAYGVNPGAAESDKVTASGIIVSECTDVQSNYLSQGTFGGFIQQTGLAALTGIDTRMLTRHIRGKGMVRCMMTCKDSLSSSKFKEALNSHDYKVKADIQPLRRIEGKGAKVAVIDYGVRNSLISALSKLDADLTIYPARTPASIILKDYPSRIILSGGAGNPKDFAAEATIIKNLCQTNIPVLAVDLGHLLLAKAFGMKPVRLKQSFRGSSVPVKCTKSGRTYITAQNTSYSVDYGSVDPEICEITYTDIFDKTVMGLKYKNINAQGIAFHLNAGPMETAFILSDFIKQ